MFHVLRLNLCVASNQVCLDGQYLNASGICVNCTVCKQPDKNVVIRPCSTHADALCGSVSDINIDLPGLSKIKPKNKNNYASTFPAKFVQLKSEAGQFLKAPVAKVAFADKPIQNTDDDDDYEDDYDYDDIKTNDTKPTPKPPKKLGKMPSDFITKDSIFDPAFESNKPGKQLKKDLNINTLNPINSNAKSIKYSVFPNLANSSEDDKKKPKNKKKKSGDLDRLKIGDTKFVIVDEKPDDRGRWIPLSHPHVVDQKIYVDFPNDTPKNKKASTFFSSSEKTDNYANEMTKLLNETTSVFDDKIFNQTNSDDQDYDGITKNLDDDDDDEDDSDDDEDDDDDKDDDEDDDDDYNFIYNDVVNRNASQKSDMEKIDPEIDDEYDLLESDNVEDKKWYQTTNDGGDIFVEPFNDSASWQILILVSAMSACLLFFVVVSTYVCIYMRKRRQFKSNFEAGRV